jgi:monoterpene epsilon-lactone hydrolase
MAGVLGAEAERRAATDEWRARDSAEARKLYPVKVEESTFGGVRTGVITPIDAAKAKRDRVLINLHGGGFNSDSGSLIEGVPTANLAKIKVVSVYYRLAPENPFPAAVDDVVAVYHELLKTYKPRDMGIFGTSAGATLTAEVAVRLKQLGLPLPAALGLFSVHPDYSRPTDSQEIFSLDGLPGRLQPRDPNRPPEEFDARLMVFEALPHAFWYHFQLPETKEALEMMATFFEEKVGR